MKSLLRHWRRAASTLAAHVPSVNVSLHRGSTPVVVRNIYCIGRNYADHARELGNAVPTEEPIIFLKASSSLRGLDGAEQLAYHDETFHFEVELVLLVGKFVDIGQLKSGKELSCLQAAGLGLDLTRRKKQEALKKAGLPWTLAKSFAGAAIVGPMHTLDHTCDLSNTSFQLKVNGAVKQEGHVNQMIFDIPYQLRFLNQQAPLLPGDLLFTGTPAGVGEIRRGDSFEMQFLSGFPSSMSKPSQGVL